MRTPKKAPSCIAIAYHPSLPASDKEGEAIASFLQTLGVEVGVCTSLYNERLSQDIQSNHVDLLIAIGGDGTMLRAGHIVAPIQIPILGINMGKFGFLTEIEKEEWRDVLPNLFEQKYWLEEHMMLQAEQWRGDDCLGSWDVLNEVVVCRGQVVRPIHLEASVDDYPLAEYVADGLIASTPTGSTAYALAVGGPIMPPELRNILIIPVAPHLSVDRAIILAEGASVRINVYTDHQAVLSADGQKPVILQEGDCVRVEAGDHTVDFVRFHDQGYFYRNLTTHMEKNPTTGGNNR